MTHFFEQNWCNWIRFVSCAEVHLSLIQEKTFTPWCCLPCTLHLGVLWFPLFLPNVKMLVMTTSALVSSEHLSKINMFVPLCICNCNLTFLFLNWVMISALLSGLLLYVWLDLFFTQLSFEYCLWLFFLLWCHRKKQCVQVVLLINLSGTYQIVSMQCIVRICKNLTLI